MSLQKTMKIALIGPGIMPIPPPGWGAVEILIWDYYQELTKRGHDVVIINTKDTIDIVNQVNAGGFDFVHLHYDVYYSILSKLECPKIAITSHYPYIDQPEKHRQDGYSAVFDFLLRQTQCYNFVLADKDYATFLKHGANPTRLKKIKNGVNSSRFAFSISPRLDRSVYLGKITVRKNQKKYQSIPNLDFIGNLEDYSFDIANDNYLGEWTREQIHKNLTNYTNLLLISQGEADPLVVKEALIAGLGVVVNKSSSENLDTSLDFITVLDEDKLGDLLYVQEKLEKNRKICLEKRQEIREYGIRTFDISNEVDRYIATIASLS
jgi:hypothetical protein